RMDYTAHGYVVGIAARMQQIAAPGTVCLAAGTAELVEGFCDLRPAGAVEVKGVSEPVPTYELIAARPERSSLDVRQSRGLSRFVGREPELDFLKSALERVKRGHGQAVAVVGGPGVGKSRLCLEMERYCADQGCEIYKAHGVPQGRLLSFYPALTLIRAFLGLEDDDSPEAAREKIRSRLMSLGEEYQERLPRIYEYLGVPDPAVKLPNIDPNVRQSRVLALIRWALLKAQRSKVMVLILEDLQWFDDSSLEIVDMLLRSVRNSQVLMIVSLRPEFQPGFVYVSQCHRLALSPLETQESIALARDLLGDSPGMTGLAERVAESSAGNPLFIEEIIQDFVESRVLEGNRGDFRLTDTTRPIKAPTGIQDVL
ncbi:MAG: ATP-binding protein, partial [Nevskiales bacterium]